jgi:tetraacyldisaccharide 4'-kinase
LESVDFVVRHTLDDSGPRPENPGTYRMHLRAGQLVQLDNGRLMSVEELGQNEIAVEAVAGIARPERFFDLLSRNGIKANIQSFPDHHRFRKADFAGIPKETMILMTEKDAVKCRGMGLPNAWYLPVEAQLSDTFEQVIKQRILDMAGMDGSAQ